MSFNVAAAMEATLFAEKHPSNAMLGVSSTNGANAIAALAASIGVVAALVIEQLTVKPAPFSGY